MTLAIVQHQSAINGSNIPGSITLSSTPTAGNLIILFLHCNASRSSVTKNTTDWIEFEDSNNGTTDYGSGVYRYVQSGDTTTLPVLWTAGTTYWAYEIYEISGVTGVFANDVPLHNSTFSATNVTALSSPGTLTVTASGSIALVGAGQYDGATNPTIDAAWTRDEFGNNLSNFGSNVSGHQASLAPGTAITATVTFTNNQSPSNLIMLVVQPSVAKKLVIDTVSYTYTPQSLILHRTRTVFVVSTQSYLVTPTDIGLNPNFHRHMYFSEFNNGDFIDWHTVKDTDFSSFFDTCQSLDSPNLKTQVPYVYTFLKDGAPTDQSALLTVEWDWANDDTSVRVTDPIQLYRYRNGFLTSISKNKIRGKGRSYHMRFDSEAGKNFDILGWVIFYDQNAQQ